MYVILILSYVFLLITQIQIKTLTDMRICYILFNSPKYRGNYDSYRLVYKGIIKNLTKLINLWQILQM